jgi:hypothetical protein
MFDFIAAHFGFLFDPIRGDWLVQILAALALLAIAWNVINRAAWDAEWKNSGYRNIRIPEQRWSYSAYDLEDFAKAAGQVSVDRVTALDFYVSRILHGSDICFAAALAAISAYVWYRVAVTPMPYEALNWVALPLGAMAILYGVADIAEDLKLAAILKHPKKVDRADAAATNMLTRIKLVAICLSLVGAAIYAIVAGIEFGVEKLRKKQLVVARPSDQ